MGYTWDTALTDNYPGKNTPLSNWCLAYANHHLIFLHSNKYSTDYLAENAGQAGKFFYTGIDIKSRESENRFMLLRRFQDDTVAEADVTEAQMGWYALTWGGYVVKGDERSFYLRGIEEARKGHKGQPGVVGQEAQKDKVPQQHQQQQQAKQDKSDGAASALGELILTRPTGIIGLWMMTGYLGPGDPTGVRGMVLTDYTVVHGAGYITVLKTKGLRCADVVSRPCPLGDIALELFMIGDETSARCNVLGCDAEAGAGGSGGATADQVAKFAQEFGGKVLTGEAHTRCQQLIAGGRVHTQQVREQEGMLEGSLHWSPTERPGQSKEDPGQLIKYVPDYYHDRVVGSEADVIETAGYWETTNTLLKMEDYPVGKTAALVGVGVWRYTPVGAIVSSLWD